MSKINLTQLRERITRQRNGRTGNWNVSVGHEELIALLDTAEAAIKYVNGQKWDHEYNRLRETLDNYE